MSETGSSLLRLKRALSAIAQEHQGIAATVGLLAASGLNHTEQMPEMCHLLQRLFKLKSCGFFWSDEHGNMQDAWCLAPDFLSFKTLMLCRQYQESGTRTWPTFQENVLMGAVAGYLLPFQNARFYASPHFRATYGTLNVRHILDVVLHDGTRPFGAFLLMRSAQQGPFTPDERSLLVKLIPILNQAFLAESRGETRYAEKEMTGFALAGRDGKCKSMSEEARRIVWTLAHPTPGSFADPDDPALECHLERIVATHAQEIESGEKHSMDLGNRWGRFNLAFEQDPMTRDTIVTLRRRVPFASQLAFQLARLDMPPMRQIVAWLLAQNRSRSQMAVELGLSVETIASHIKLIYKQAETSSGHGLLLRLAN